MTIRPAARASRTRSERIATIRARPCAVSVTMPACEPVNDTASRPRSLIAIERSAIEIRSPAVSSMSRSRGCGLGETSAASASRSSVVSPIAETTTQTPPFEPAVDTIRPATRRIRSGDATDVPPYFCTIRPTRWTLPRLVRTPRLRGIAPAEANVVGVGGEVDDLPGRDPALRLAPELRCQQVGVVAQERLANTLVPEQERLELLREHVAWPDGVPDVLRQLGLRGRRRRNGAELAVGQILDLVVVVEEHAVVARQ